MTASIKLVTSHDMKPNHHCATARSFPVRNASHRPRVASWQGPLHLHGNSGVVLNQQKFPGRERG